MPRHSALALSLVVSGLTVAACGSSSPSTGLSASTKRASMIAFASCMRSHGVPNFPDPGNNGHGGLQIQASQRAGSGASMSVNGVAVNAPKFQSAMNNCRKNLPNGGRPSTADSAQMKKQALAMARCMRTHGVTNFPDPQFTAGPGGGFGIKIAGAGVDPNSPVFQAAQKACQPLFGGPKSVQSGP